MKKQVMMVLLAVTLIFSIGACGTTEYEPAAIQDGVDRCDVCNMMIKDDQHATQIVLKDGKVLKFDDIGDMFVWTKENGMDHVGARFVRDYHTKEWVNLEEAAFVYDKNFQTPMAYGVYSFKTKEDAEAFIAQQKTGTLLSAEDLENHHWERNMEMMKKMKEAHMKEGHADDQHGDGHGMEQENKDGHMNDDTNMNGEEK